MVGRTAPITQADRQRFDAITQIGCLACLIEGVSGTPAEVNHATDCGHRMQDEHRNTYGLCQWHHRGELFGFMKGSVKAVESIYGPSLRLSSRAFHEHYGTEQELVSIQDAMIRMLERERRSGRYLQPGRLSRLARMVHREVVLKRSPSPAEVSRC